VIYSGEDCLVSVDARDNIGIQRIEWKWFGGSLNGSEVNLPVAEAGTHEIKVHVYDHQGLETVISFNLTVLSRTHDSDGDGIPDLYEIERSLDMNDPSDAVDDIDGDGLTNLEEYLNGTDPRKDDTDSDGQYDLSEIENGSDPLDPDSRYSSEDDDDDGHGHDGDSGSSGSRVLTVLIILIIIAVVALLAAGLTFFLLRRRREEEGEGAQEDISEEREGPEGEEGKDDIGEPEEPEHIDSFQEAEILRKLAGERNIQISHLEVQYETAMMLRSQDMSNVAERSIEIYNKNLEGLLNP
jgi:hypothetical protein